MNYLHTMSAATFVVVKQDAIIMSEALNQMCKYDGPHNASKIRSDLPRKVATGLKLGQ